LDPSEEDFLWYLSFIFLPKHVSSLSICLFPIS
jgi:hypothetical protein